MLFLLYTLLALSRTATEAGAWWWVGANVAALYLWWEHRQFATLLARQDGEIVRLQGLLPSSYGPELATRGAATRAANGRGACEQDNQPAEARKEDGHDGWRR